MDKRYLKSDTQYIKCSLPNCQARAVVIERINEKNFNKCSAHLQARVATASTGSFREEMRNLRKARSNVRDTAKHRV